MAWNNIGVLLELCRERPRSSPPSTAAAPARSRSGSSPDQGAPDVVQDDAVSRIPPTAGMKRKKKLRALRRAIKPRERIRRRKIFVFRDSRAVAPRRERSSVMPPPSHPFDFFHHQRDVRTFLKCVGDN